MSVLKLRVICPRPDLRQRTLSHTMSSSFCPSFVSSFCTRTLGGPTWLLLAPNDDQHPDNPNPGNRGAVRAVCRAASPVRFSGRQTFPLPDKGRFCAVQPWLSKLGPAPTAQRCALTGTGSPVHHNRRPGTGANGTRPSWPRQPWNAPQKRKTPIYGLPYPRPTDYHLGCLGITRTLSFSPVRQQG